MSTLPKSGRSDSMKNLNLTGRIRPVPVIAETESSGRFRAIHLMIFGRATSSAWEADVLPLNDTRFGSNSVDSTISNNPIPRSHGRGKAGDQFTCRRIDLTSNRWSRQKRTRRSGFSMRFLAISDSELSFGTNHFNRASAIALQKQAYHRSPDHHRRLPLR